MKLKKGQLVPWDADFKGGSKEWRAKMLWKQYTDNVWRNLHTAIKNTVTKGEYLKFKQKLRFIETLHFASTSTKYYETVR